MNKLIRKKQVLEATGLSITTIWRLERKGLFPRRRRISQGSVAWSAAEVDNWISEKLSDSTAKSPRSLK